jgi:uncharacterized delta-60 repeat protein
VLVGGDFANIDSEPRVRIARLNGDGNIDLTFVVPGGADQTVRAFAVQTNGQILLGGDFEAVGGVTRRGVARLNSNGAIDSAFNPSVNGSVRALAVQADGKVLVGGLFTTVGVTTRPFLARLTIAGQIDPTFALGSGPNGPIYSIAVQNDGKILIAGNFTSVAANGPAYVARLNLDGTVDSGFITGTGPDAAVNAAAVHSSGRIILGGAFTNFNGLSRNRFARLRSNGALDTAFDTGTGANSNVLALAVQPDTAVVIGGEFTQVDGLARNRIARIHGEERSNLIRVEFANSTFSVPEEAGPGVLTVVRSGNTNAAFTIQYASSPGAATAPADYTTTTGTLSFGSNEVSKTISIPIASDLLLEGDEALSVYLFNFPASSDNTGVTNAALVIPDNERMVQHAANIFSVLEGFTNAMITAVRLGGQSGIVTVNYATSDGTAFSGQDYTGVSDTLVFEDHETNKTFLVPLLDNFVRNNSKTFTVTLSGPGNATLGNPASATVTIIDDEVPGNLDRGFTPGTGANGLVRSVAVQADGRILLGGAFTTFNEVPRKFVTRLNTDGSQDLTFDPGTGANALVSSVASMSGNRVMLGGFFTGVNGVPYRYVARLNSNGAPDLMFNQSIGLNAAVNTLAVFSNGRILLGGAFSVPSRGISRLAASGAVDISFSPGPGANDQVHSLILQPDGSAIIGGAFTSLAGEPRSRVARLDASGQVDTEFGAIPAISSGTVYSSARQSDGKVIVVGDFVPVSGTVRTRIARLNTDGSLDNGFNSGVGANAIIYSVGVQASDKVVIVGDFTSFDGVSRSRIARLDADGSIDLSFDPGSGANATVYALTILPDDNVLIGGAFTTINGQPRRGIARLFAGDSAQSGLQLTSVTVTPGGVMVTFTGIPGHTYVFEASSDLINWLDVDTATAVDATVTFTDSGASGFDQRFYRVREVLP